MFNSGKNDMAILAENVAKIASGDYSVQVSKKMMGRSDSLGRLAQSIEQIRIRSAENAEKENRGTDIILHLNAESEEFLDTYKVKSILEKFCRFLPIPINYNYITL